MNSSALKMLQRKVFGVPAWVLGVIAVGLLAYYLYRKHASAAAAAAAAGTTAASSGASGTASSDNGIGDQVGYLGGYPTVSGTSPGVTTGPTGIADPGPVSTPAPSVPQQTQQGSGYWLGPVATPIHGQDGYWYQWESPAVAAAFPSAQRYIQIEPGYFVAMTSSTHLAAGTPQFLRTAAPVPGYNYGPTQIPGVAAPVQPSSSTHALGALTPA